MKHIKQSNTSEVENYKTHTVNLTEKIRNDVLNNSKNNRYKVVNYFRSKGAQDSQAEEHKDVTIVDVEENQDVKIIKEDLGSSYVYDLYYTNSDDFGEANLDDLIK